MAFRHLLTGFRLHLILGHPHWAAVPAGADRAVRKQDLRHVLCISTAFLSLYLRFACREAAVQVYLDGAVPHVSDYGSVAADGAGQFFREAGIQEESTGGPLSERETLPHHHTPV